MATTTPEVTIGMSVNEGASKPEFVMACIAHMGHKGKDKVTEFEGVITRVCFDLYGCVQVSLVPPKDEKGALPEPYIFDIQRILLLDDDPVMENPFLDLRPEAEPMPADPKDYNRGAETREVRQTY